jgi:predicted dehydrogenase
LIYYRIWLYSEPNNLISGNSGLKGIMKPVSVLIVGAGDRGQAYARHIKKHPERMRVVGVAEPRAFQRGLIATEHALSDEHIFSDWRAAAAADRMADAVIIATQDSLHVEPTVAFAGKGYHIMLEKPMAPTEEDCLEIVRAVRESGVIFALCHVLRYTPYTTRLKGILDSGAIGDLVSVQHLEPVGFWHQAHSFVRGNWRNEAESSFMLLAKSCHDLDWVHYLVGAPCRRISSFGGLKHFRRDQRPAGAGDRCLDCAVEEECPYSARRLYMGLLEKNKKGWPLSIITDDLTEKGVLEALEHGPYGRCVYACDNDVVDHQVVGMEYQNGVTATFTMTAFTGTDYGRTTRIFGSRGEILGDSRKIQVTQFLTGETEAIDTQTDDVSLNGGHGGGDGGVLESFIASVAEGDSARVTTGIDEAWASHQLVFAAEQARRERRVVDLLEQADMPQLSATLATGEI